MKKLLPLLALLSLPAFADDDAETIWKARCKGCHGMDGKANTKTGKKENVPDMTTPDWQSRHSDEQIRLAIAEGSKEKPKMKPFKNKLTPAEIDSLVKYIRTLK